VRPQKQRFRHRPDAGEYGDCHRTAIACLLDLDRDEVPNFGEHYDNGDAFKAAEHAFLAGRGYGVVSYAFDCSLEQLLAALEALNPGIYYLLCGESRTGVNHTVIGCGGMIAWDPSIDDAGIVGPCDDGRYWVSHLIPLAFVREPIEAAA